MKMVYRYHGKREEKKNNFLQGFTTMTEAIMNGNKDTEDLE